MWHLKKFEKFTTVYPMLIADYFTAEALHSCRAEGIIATTPRTQMSHWDLLRTLSNAAAMSANPQIVCN
jgi:hypothetical protein